jgi:tetratricopeptide (TPR) repeat protein
MKIALFPRALVAALAFASSALLTAKEPLFEGLGTHTRKITTKSPEAQRYFNQGLAWFYGFHHAAAIRSFQEAARIDPECAMAYWGVALANGPHINVPMVPPPAAEQAWQALTQAQKFAPKTSPVERELIAALATRYANPQPEDRTPLDRAYAEAMRKTWRGYSKDADVGALFAESMMTLRPWDLWTPDGKPQPGTEEVVATLDTVLKLNVSHPFANHLYIHALEASLQPERAVAAADRLRDLQPALAHNVHMPSHIDIRNGRWQEAITANVKAIEASRRLRARMGPPPSGPIYLYNAHNHHMLAYAAMMTGQSELAISQIRTMAANLPEDFLKDFALFADGYVAMPYEVLLRFGRWDDVLAAPDHPEHLPYARAMRHNARGVALAAKGDTAGARAEQQAYLAAAKQVPSGTSVGPVDVQTIIAVATPMLEGEILYREGKAEPGIAKLQEAVKAEDALRYFEPPAWFLPVRHALGAALMQSGKYAEAEQVYREDLKRLPGNGWSLFGLAESLRVRGKTEEAEKAESNFQNIWKTADVKINSSCMCQPGVKSSLANRTQG